jgi:TonB-linked SusC/RagA family outer membrane protein
MQKRTRLLLWLTAVLAFVVMTPAMVLAQTATFTGKVTAKTGPALYGANVTIDALSVSIGTSVDGSYSFTVPGGKVTGQTVVLRVRAIGYVPVTKSVQVTAGSHVNDFVLDEDINRLSQVVITGVTAGTEQKKLPFTVASVSEKEMPVPGSNVLNSLQGKVPGAQMVPGSGQPGSTPSIILRAPQSLNASATGRSQGPLFIVDGVIQQGSIRDIAPEDIENVEIVKGAAASTLYGSRAGSGVIQITTRSGKNGGEGVRFTTRIDAGASDIEGAYRTAHDNFIIMDPTYSRYCVANNGGYLAARESQNCMQTADLAVEAFRVNDSSAETISNPVNFLMDGGINPGPAAINLKGMFQVNPWNANYNPVEQMVTHGPYTNANVDMTGKFGRANFFASVGDYRQQGSIVYLDGFHRNNLRLNVDNTLGGNWTFSARTYYAHSQLGNNTSGSTYPSFLYITRQPLYVDLFRTDSHGRLFVRSDVLSKGIQNVNPAYQAQNAIGETGNDRFLGSASIRWQPLTWVDGTFDFGYDRTNTQDQGMTIKGYRITTNSSPSVPLGSLARSGGFSQSYNASMNWTARRDLLSNLAGRLTIRGTYEQQDDNSDRQSGSQLAVPGITNTQALITSQAISSSESSQRAIGLVGSVNLEYKERYILESSFRRDGLSVFGAAHRWQTYGRGSFAWRASEEKWWPFAKTINDFKLRYSVGQAGNRPGNTSQYQVFTIGTGGTLSPQTLGNKFLAPEVATETEFGFDAEILHKYGLTITNAHDITKDQILLVTLPAAAGFTNQWQNAGTLDGKTWEASLNVPLIERRDLTWTARLNWDAIRSKITALSVPAFYQSLGGDGNGQTYIGPNQTFGEIWGHRFVQTCNQLPAAFVSRCGAGLEWQRNSDGLIVWTGAGHSVNDGITNNLWQATLPAAQAPWGKPEAWGMSIDVRDSTGALAILPNGHGLPDFRWSLANTFTFKKFSVYLLMDAQHGTDVWNEELHWSLGDFQAQLEDQAGRSVGTAKPLGYYWRLGAPESSGVGGWYDQLGTQMQSVEDASYLKVRELSVGYRIGKIAGTGDWSVSFIGRNLKTWTNYRGFDPEVGQTGGNNGSAVLNTVDGFNFPNLRTFSFTLSTSF